jgi:molecular chaperone DnaJ
VKKEEIDLPGGLRNNQKLRIFGLGHASDVFMGQNGDLLLDVKLKNHKLFTLEDDDIVSEITLSLSEAILGCKLTVETVDGKINIEL